jgi:hypothetical protein
MVGKEGLPMQGEMFDSTVRSTGDLAGVFEYAEGAGYFYLYEISESQEDKVVDYIRVISSTADFGESDVAIAWDAAEERVGLFIRDVLWAVFDVVTERKYGGDYQKGGEPEIPSALSFGTRRYAH